MWRHWVEVCHLRLHLVLTVVTKVKDCSMSTAVTYNEQVEISLKTDQDWVTATADY